ncbi:OmpA-like protein [Actibacterium atlanticum]|uniref:OmpA-like protein n=1 Tax=Actibacterium atlanticum TaxID=1461693 RepID=A0A058ZJ50_9RHOB|nr:OmpA family protein [Actibacterium atlanticum]KCV80821.1 OmpA-like protein [Actibacterium atlanticum]
MRLAPNLIALSAIVIAALLALLTAVLASHLIEARAESEIHSALARESITWAQADADGLQVHMTGTAPTEALRFRALTITGTIVDAARVLDEMEVTPAKPFEAPEFKLELLRNETGVSMIGLIPAGEQREDISSTARDAADGAPITDMLNTADYPAPEGWQAALEFGLKALDILPRSKISIAADSVAITAISDSESQKASLEDKLRNARPDGVDLAMNISAPRPVITPFTLRFLIDEDGARFDACSAEENTTATRILAAARAVGLEGKATCTIGLGMPSPRWGEAAEMSIKALKELGGGSVTMADADITLIALDTTPQRDFDKITGALEADLPDVFSLHAVLPEPVEIDGRGEGDGPPEFVATLSPEGLVQLRGRVTDLPARSATESYARARFGLNKVHGGMVLDAELPDGWPLRVLTGLEGLSQLTNGSLIVQPEFLELRGVTTRDDANAEIARLFSQKLGDAQNYKIDVAYEAPPEPEDQAPAPEVCVANINDILTAQKITFEPGSVTIDGASRDVIDQIVEVLRECPDVPMEIGGHTDSQGSEKLNLSLSQQRADAVLNALVARRVLISNLTAKGYGEATPIADNETEAGREANRRIAFTLIAPEPATDDTAQETPSETEDTNEPD